MIDNFKKLNKNQKIQFIIEIILFFIISIIWILVIKNNIYFSKINNIPCYIYYATGYYCPGCGGTRSVDAFLHFDFLASLIYHPVPIISFIIYLRSLISLVLYLFHGNKEKIKEININDIMILDFIILACFIARNVLVLMFKF